MRPLRDVFLLSFAKGANCVPFSYWDQTTVLPLSFIDNHVALYWLASSLLRSLHIYHIILVIVLDNISTCAPTVPTGSGVYHRSASCYRGIWALPSPSWWQFLVTCIHNGTKPENTRKKRASTRPETWKSLLFSSSL